MDDESYYNPNDRRCTRVLSPDEVLFSWKETDPSDSMDNPNSNEDLSEKLKNMTPEEITEFVTRLSHSDESLSEEEEITNTIQEQIPPKKSNKNKAATTNQQKKATVPKKNNKNIKQVSSIEENDAQSEIIENAPEIKKQVRVKEKTGNPKPTSPIEEIEIKLDPEEEEPEIKRQVKVKKGKKEKINNANINIDSTVPVTFNTNNLTDEFKSEAVEKSKKTKKGARGKQIQATENSGDEEIPQQNLGIEDELNKLKIESLSEDQDNPKKNLKKSKVDNAAKDSKEVKKTNSRTAKGKTTKKEVETLESNVTQEAIAQERNLRSTRGKSKQEHTSLKETDKSQENDPPSKVMLNEEVSTSERGKKTTKNVTGKTKVEVENTVSKTVEPNLKKKTNNSKQKNSDNTTNNEVDTVKKNNPKSKAAAAKVDKTSEKKENNNIITEPVQVPKRATRKK